MIEYLINLTERYGGIVIGSLAGAVVQRIRDRAMSVKKFLGVLFMSAFVGLCVGVFVRTYLNVSDEILYAICSMAGVFSSDILNEIEKVISYISVYVKTKFKIKTDESEID